MTQRSIAARRTVVVTGGTAGIGRAIAHRFARAGDRIGLIARDEAALEATKRELEVFGAEVATASADMADAKAVFAAAEALERQLGPVDLWVNDAMETVFSTVAEMSPEEFRRVTEVTYLGFVHGTMAALRSMRPRGRGRILQMGSALAYRGIPLQSAYCGAKHAIRGFTEALRTELIHEGSGISIAVVDLPAVNTPQFDWARAHIPRSPRPMGRPVQPEIVAEAVFRAARGSWREYWLGWPTLMSILGNTVLPGYLDRRLAREAVDGQQTAVPLPPDRADNLQEPVPSLHRIHGSFNDEAGGWAPLVPGEVARVGTVALGGVLCLAAGLCLGRRLGKQRR